MEIDQALRVIEERVPDHELRERMATALIILVNTHYKSGRGYDDIAVMDACRQLEGSSPAGGRRGD